jgi:hypothetical protein
MPAPSLESWTIDRSTSAWRDFTQSYEEEQAGRHVRAVALGTTREALAAGLEVPGHLLRPGCDAPLIAIDRAARRVVVSADAFGDLARIDATSLVPGETHALGSVRDAAFLADPRSLVRFLVMAQLVQAYVHVEASVSLVAECDDGTRYRASFEAVHTYYTNTRHDVPYAFALRLDRAPATMPGRPGDMSIEGAVAGRTE